MQKFFKISLEQLLTIWLLSFLLLEILLLPGCTMQFKAKDLELEGHSNTTYEFSGVAWTEKPTDIPDPTD